MPSRIVKSAGWTSVKLALLLAFGAACAAVGGGIVYLLSNKEHFALSHEAVPMAAQISLEKQNLCESLSPSIRVQNIPPGAKHMSVRITDLNYLFDHGGGIVAVPPSGEISEGALPSYIGLCPGPEDHTYRFRVDALDDANKIIGIAEVARPCCSQIRAKP